MLFSNAYAADAAPSISSGLSGMLPLVLIFLVFYLLIIRPQSKRLKEHQNLVQSLQRGDNVVTTGGITGVVTAIKQESDIIEVEIAEGVTVNVKRQAVTERLEVTKKKSPARPAASGRKKKKAT